MTYSGTKESLVLFFLLFLLQQFTKRRSPRQLTCNLVMVILLLIMFKTEARENGFFGQCGYVCTCCVVCINKCLVAWNALWNFIWFITGFFSYFGINLLKVRERNNCFMLKREMRCQTLKCGRARWMWVTLENFYGKILKIFT